MQVKCTVTDALFQPAVLGVGETEAEIPGAVVSTLMPDTAALVELSAMSVAVPVADWFAPSTVNGAAAGAATPEPVSAQDHVNVTAALYQPFAFAPVRGLLIVGGVLSMFRLRCRRRVTGVVDRGT